MPDVTRLPGSVIGGDVVLAISLGVAFTVLLLGLVGSRTKGALPLHAAALLALAHGVATAVVVVMWRRTLFALPSGAGASALCVDAWRDAWLLDDAARRTVLIGVAAQCLLACMALVSPALRRFAPLAAALLVAGIVALAPRAPSVQADIETRCRALAAQIADEQSFSSRRCELLDDVIRLEGGVTVAARRLPSLREAERRCAEGERIRTRIEVRNVARRAVGVPWGAR